MYLNGKASELVGNGFCDNYCDHKFRDEHSHMISTICYKNLFPNNLREFNDLRFRFAYQAGLFWHFGFKQSTLVN